MTTHAPDPRSARATLTIGDQTFGYFALDRAGAASLERLPYTVKVLLENMLRGAATHPDLVTADHVLALASWDASAPGEAESALGQGSVSVGE